MRSSSVSSERSSIQAECGSVIVPIVLRIERMGSSAALDPVHAARHKIRMAAGIFGEAVEDEVRPVRQRLLPQGAEEGVVDDDGRLLAAVGEVAVAHAATASTSTSALVGVGGAFEVDEGDAARAFRLGDDGLDLGLGRAGREIQPVHAEAAEDAGDQRLGRGIERAGMDDRVAGADQRQHDGRDRRPCRRRR